MMKEAFFTTGMAFLALSFSAGLAVPGAAGEQPAKPPVKVDSPKPAPAKKQKWMRGQTGAGATKYGRVIPEGPSTEAPKQPWPLVTYGPEAEKEFTVKREAVFAFARKPAVARKNGKVEIAFESKGRCDATVAIEMNDGAAGPRIVRHLASGLLGANAPELLQKNSLQQTLTWDGKDDFGRPVADIAACTVRVSLELLRPPRPEAGLPGGDRGGPGRRLPL